MLVEVADGQEQHGELILAQVPQDVTLVLVAVRPTHEKVVAVTNLNLGVVAGRHCVKAQARGALEE